MCQPAREWHTEFPLLTCIPSCMSDTNVTAPPGLSVCCHLWEACWAFASVSISQTVVRPEQLRTANFIWLPRRFCMQESPSLHPLLLLLPLPFSFLFSPHSILLTTCPASAEIECELSHFLSQRQRILTLWKLCVFVMAAIAHELWGLQACWTSYFPQQSLCRCAEVGSIC